MLQVINGGLGRGKQMSCPRNYVLGTNRDGVWLCYPKGGVSKPISPTLSGAPAPAATLDVTCPPNPLCDPASGACVDTDTGQPCVPQTPAPATASASGSSLGLYLGGALALIAAGFIGWGMSR